MFLEVACFCKESAVIAAKAGVDRIEFCAEMDLGGITPPLEDFLELKSLVKIPVFVMIRSRGGNFVYSESELKTMQHSLLEFKQAGADGFVFGILDKNNQVESESCKQLLSLTDNLPCTFHRAFDCISDKEAAMETLIDLGFRTVLSSGGEGAAIENLHVLEDLQQKYGQRIHIMPGGGVRASNLSAILKKVKPNWVHSSGIKKGESCDYDEIKEIKNYFTSS